MSSRGLSTYGASIRWGILTTLGMVLAAFMTLQIGWLGLSTHTFKAAGVLFLLCSFYTVRLMHVMKYYSGISDLTLNLRMFWYVFVAVICMNVGSKPLYLDSFWVMFVIYLGVLDSCHDIYKTYVAIDNLKYKL